MTGVLMGKYYKTFEAAQEAFLKLSEWDQKNKVIVEFENAFMIVSNEQVKAFENGKK